MPPPAKTDVMLSLCHLWARSAFISQKREGRERGGSAGLCLPQPFWCMEPSQNSNGKTIHRQREASVQRGACVQAGRDAVVQWKRSFRSVSHTKS